MRVQVAVAKEQRSSSRAKKKQKYNVHKQKESSTPPTPEEPFAPAAAAASISLHAEATDPMSDSHSSDSEPEAKEMKEEDTSNSDLPSSHSNTQTQSTSTIPAYTTAQQVLGEFTWPAIASGQRSRLQQCVGMRLTLPFFCLFSCLCRENYPGDFKATFTEWLLRIKNMHVLLRPEKYEHILETIRDGHNNRKGYQEWVHKYKFSEPVRGEVFLTIDINIHHKKAASGHAVAKEKRKKKRKSDADAEVELTEQQLEEEWRLSEVPEMKESDENAQSTAYRAVLIMDNGRGSAMPVAVSREARKIPRLLNIPDVIKDIHEKYTHCGIHRLFQKVRDEYIGITRDLCEAYIKRCQPCAAARPESKVQTKVIPIRCERFLQRVQMDCMSFADQRFTPPKVRIILHLQDHFTKWSWVYEIPNKLAKTIVDKFQEFCLQWGVPEILQTDNGREFVNAELTSMLNSLLSWTGTKLESGKIAILFVHGRPYNPAAQGSVERANGVLRVSLEFLCVAANRKLTFPHLLRVAMWVMNTLWHRGLGMCSYKLVFNRTPSATLPINLELEEHLSTEFKEVSLEEAEVTAAAADSLTSLTVISQAEVTRAAMEASAAAHLDVSAAAHVTADRYTGQWLRAKNKNASSVGYQVGELVWLVPNKVPRPSKAVAKSINKFLAVVIKITPQHDLYQLYTLHGVMSTIVKGEALRKVDVGIQRPKEFGIDPVAVLAEYKAINKKDKGVTIQKILKTMLNQKVKYSWARLIVADGDKYVIVLKVEKQ